MQYENISKIGNGRRRAPSYWMALVTAIAILEIVHHGIIASQFKSVFVLESYEVPFFHTFLLFAALLEFGRSLRARFQALYQPYDGIFKPDEMIEILLCVLQSASVGLVITDRLGHVIWVSDEYSKISGIHARTLIGVQPALFKWGTSELGRKAAFWDKLEKGECFEEEFSRTRVDGRPYREKASVVPFEEPNGSNKYFLYFCEDISKEHKERKQLQERERRHRMLIETMTDGLVLTNTSEVITYANPSFLRMLGYSLGELKGKHFPDLLDEKNQAILEEANLVRRTGEIHRYEIQVTSRDGSPISFLVSPSIVKNHRGYMVGTFAVFSRPGNSHLSENQEAA